MADGVYYILELEETGRGDTESAKSPSLGVFFQSNFIHIMDGVREIPIRNQNANNRDYEQGGLQTASVRAQEQEAAVRGNCSSK